MNKQIATLIEAYRKTGRVAHHYPRKRRVSLNGAKAISEVEAAKVMRETLSKAVI